jgi:DNA-binding NtrC family response regulator
VEHFLTTRRIGSARFSVQPEALAALVRYPWPGNVRELANVLERAQILAEGSVITLDDLPETLLCGPLGADDASQEAESQKLQQIQRRHVLAVLRQEKGNKVHAARSLGISRRALYRLLEKYQIQPEEGTAEES